MAVTIKPAEAARVTASPIRMIEAKTPKTWSTKDLVKLSAGLALGYLVLKGLKS